MFYAAILEIGLCDFDVRSQHSSKGFPHGSYENLKIESVVCCIDFKALKNWQPLNKINIQWPCFRQMTVDILDIYDFLPNLPID